MANTARRSALRDYATSYVNDGNADTGSFGMHRNTQKGSPREGQLYRTKKIDGGELHIYQGGQRIVVKTHPSVLKQALSLHESLSSNRLSEVQRGHREGRVGKPRPRTFYDREGRVGKSRPRTFYGRGSF